MTLIDLLLSYGLTAGAHTMGHLTEAGNRGHNTWISGMEEHSAPFKDTKEDNEKALAIHGAGFKGQDTLNRAINSPESNLANAIYKTSYLIGGPKIFGGSTNSNGGDIGSMEKQGAKSGVVKPMLAASAIANLFKAAYPEALKDYDLNFDQSSTGTPILRLDVKW